MARIPVILGTLTNNCIINVRKEKEINALATPWANARVAHFLSVCRMAAIKVGDEILEEPSSDDYDKVVYIWNVETIEAFSSHVVQVRVERAHTGGHINILIQALQTGDGSLLLGLTIQSTYMELRQGSKNAVMVVRNSTAYPLKENPSGQSTGSNPCAGTTDGSPVAGGGNKPKNPHTPKLTVRQRHGKLFDELDLSGLDSLPPELVDNACQLLAEYHDMFSLDPTELGCTHSTEHKIKETDDTVFKE